MLATIEEFIDLLRKVKIPFCIIGGVAVLLLGGRASTIDFDIYLLAVDLEKLQAVLTKQKISFNKLGDSQLKIFFKGIYIDVLAADEVIGEHVIDRAKNIKVGKKKAPVATAEDLIILKTIADRPIDRRDVSELREIFAGQIDESYIKKQLKKYSDAIS